MSKFGQSIGDYAPLSQSMPSQGRHDCCVIDFIDFTRIRGRERLCTIPFLGTQFSTCSGEVHDKFQTGGDRGLGHHGRRGRQPGAGRGVRLPVLPDVQQLSRLQQLSGLELSLGTMFLRTMSIRAVSFRSVRLCVRGAVKLNERDLLVFVLCAIGLLWRKRRRFNGQLPERLLRDGLV